MPVQNRKLVKHLLDRAAIAFGVASTNKEMGVPYEVDDEGYTKVVVKYLTAAFTFIGNCLSVVRGPGNLVIPVIITTDTQLKSAAGYVYWMTICGDDVLYVEINDSIGDTPGNDRWGQFYPADNYSHYIFDPPIECDTGIYIDITTNGNAQVVVGYE